MERLTLEEIISRFRSDRRFMENVRAFREIPAAAGRFSPLPAWLHPRLRAVLEARGFQNLYEHQAEALELVRRGRDVVLVTPTASGKTLCYNIPVLQRALEVPDSRALYLFPTKALAQDQLKEFGEMARGLGGEIKSHTYDGDTPDDARQAIRRQANVVITNPDMLHAGILPHHTKWQKLFSSLDYVVIDELHTYRGVFGSHLANVIRRLRRIARFYGKDPLFICCSATVANPGEHAARLVGKEFALIDRSGAPRAAKTFIFYNPPVVNRELGIRQSALAPARKIALQLMDNGIQTILFAGSRLTVEVLTKYLKDGAEKREPGAEKVVAGYRGGYLPELRRRIERDLREKNILGVVGTNALELGIDIGELDACIMVGYPGSIAGTWQQSGRAGRRADRSLALLIARSSPMDQFITENPEYFFAGSPEHCRINPDNLLILVSHIKCAAFELPFEEGESFGEEKLEEFLAYLEEKGILHSANGRWHWTAEHYPANEIGLRSIDAENVVVVDVTEKGGRRVIAEVDWDSAFTTVHEHAIYMVESEQYHVDRLDLDRREAHVRKVDVDYYTDAMTYTDIRVLDGFETKQDGNAVVEHGEVKVSRKVVGYKKIKFYTAENVGYGEVSLPEREMHTTSYWFTLPLAMLDTLPYTRAEMIDGLCGLAYAVHHIAAMILMADIRDMDRCVADRSGRWFVHFGPGGRKPASAGSDSPENFDPTVFIYDAYPGGIGFSDLLFRIHRDILAAAFRLISSCPCAAGCPGCVGPVLDVGYRAKKAALSVIEIALGSPPGKSPAPPALETGGENGRTESVRRKGRK
ncbi:MAG: DEAD/DEAH box helicase [Syntrophales bacterium]|nr:DEAD/DEAH box helicase [Syntrophales bacterium]